jgi:hypothetical protein
MRTTLSLTAVIIVSALLFCPATSLAEPEQNLILSIKKDPGDGYLNSDMDGVWY